MSGARVFHGGVVYTADPDGSVVEAVAVRDGRILLTGTDREIFNDQLGGRPIAATW